MPDRSILIDLSLRESAPFRRIFIARLISLVGIGMLMVSVPIQMYELTKSSAHVGATATTGISTFIGMLIGGILADKYDRRIMIIIGRTGAMLAFGAWQPTRSGVFGGEPRFVAVYALPPPTASSGALSIAALMASFRRCCRKEKMVAVGALNSISVRGCRDLPRCRRSDHLRRRCGLDVHGGDGSLGDHGAAAVRTAVDAADCSSGGSPHRTGPR